MCSHLNRLIEAILINKHNIPFSIEKKKITLNYPKLAVMRFFSQGTQERVRNSSGKRAISVRATEVLLFLARDTHNVQDLHWISWYK